MTTAVHSTTTDFGPITVSQTSGGQLIIHKMASRLWLPMLVMGVMALAIAAGLGIAQAQVGSDLGAEFTALRKANFETLQPLTAGFLFLGEALLLSGIAFLLGTILGALRSGGGEVQESVGAQVKTLQMPWSAKVFLVLMMAGLMLELVAFGTLAFVASQAHGAWIGATAVDAPGNINALNRATAYAAWANPLREVALATILTSIVFALYTISSVLSFQFSRIRELIVGRDEGGI